MDQPDPLNLWPEVNQLAEALREYLDEATERIIREKNFKDPIGRETRRVRVHCQP